MSLLEHHRSRTPPQPREFGLTGPHDIRTADRNTPGSTGVAGQQPEGGERDGRLPRPGLTDEGERLPGLHPQGHPTHGGYITALGGEGDTQIRYPQDAVHPRPFTSKASRSPSPIALNAHTTRMIARPGGTISHQRPEYAAVSPAESMPPQSVDGG